MNVVITEAAWENMLHIGRWIGADNPQRAQTFVAELYERCESLGRIPLAFPLIPGREDRGIRRRSHGDDLIFYRVTETQVEVLHVLHVLHGAREYDPILFPDS